MIHSIDLRVPERIQLLMDAENVEGVLREVLSPSDDDATFHDTLSEYRLTTHLVEWLAARINFEQGVRLSEEADLSRDTKALVLGRMAAVASAAEAQKFIAGIVESCGHDLGDEELFQIMPFVRAACEEQGHEAARAVIRGLVHYMYHSADSTARADLNTLLARASGSGVAPSLNSAPREPVIVVLVLLGMLVFGIGASAGFIPNPLSEPGFAETIGWGLLVGACVGAVVGLVVRIATVLRRRQ